MPQFAPARRGPPGLWLLLGAALALDVLRALTVPAGVWNIDEAYHFVDLQNAARLLPYEARHRLGSREAPPALLDGGALADPRRLFHPPGWLPVRGTAYHLLQALVQLPLAGAPEAARLLAARLVTVALHGAVIALAYSTARRMLPPGAAPWAPLAAAGLAAFVPSYSDMLSAVNLDAGAAAAGALYLWALARLAREGFRLRLAATLAAAALLGLSTKETFWPLLPATGLALAWLRAGRQARALAALGAAVLATAAILGLRPLTEGGAAYWFDAEWRYGQDASLAPRARTASPLGEFALRLDRRTSAGVAQFVPETQLGPVRGQTVSWGVWLRASPPAQVTLGLHTGADWIDARTVRATADWAFYGGQAQMPDSLAHLALRLGSSDTESVIDYDGAVVAAGETPADAPPVFTGADGERGQWAGRPFANLLLNPSAEASWPQVKQEYNVRPRNLNTRLNAVLAWQRSLPAAAGLARWLLANYWSGFGGLLPGLGPRGLVPLAALTGWAGLGAAAILTSDLPRRRGLGRERSAAICAWLLAAAALAAWLVVIYRTDFVPSTAEVIVWSVTRHASAGLTATCAWLALGLLRWLPRRAQPWAVAALILGLFLVNVWILLGVQMPYYHCPAALPTDCLTTVH